MAHRILSLSLAALFLCAIFNSAHADCSNPAAPEAKLIYNQDYHVLQFCNGTEWRAVGQPASCEVGGGGGGGTGYFVLTNTTYNGNLGGFSGANAKCLTEITTNTTWKYYTAANSAGLLNSTHVQAFLCYDETLNGQCQNLTPSTAYYFARVGSATAGGSSFTTNTYALGPNDSANWSGASYFSGTYTYWTSRYSPSTTNFYTISTSQGGDCDGWTSTSSGGDEGTSNSTDNGRWGTATPGCNTSQRLICAVNP